MMVSLTVSLFFSGMVMPARASSPTGSATLAHALPFAAIMQTPIDIWLGKHHGAALAGILALQAFWALVFLGLGRLRCAPDGRSWWSRVVEPSSSGGASSALRSGRSSSTGCRSCSTSSATS